METIETIEASRILSSAVIAGAGGASLEEPMHCIVVGTQGTQGESAARRWPGGRVDNVVDAKLTRRITPHDPNCLGS